jgi:Uncharacterized protein conserved in bacteria
MTIASLTAELARETRTTRRYLERLPGDKLDWRPHVKSYTAGGLASHLMFCVAWTDAIFSSDEFDVDPSAMKRFQATSVAELLSTFDETAANAQRVLATASDASLQQPWRFKVMGRQLFERSKAAVFRDFSLSHLIHHRGQFSVYLRLLDIALPGAYGPTADETF